MEKNEMIDFLIENEEFSGWGEDDRAGLEELEEGGLKRLCLLTNSVIENAGQMDDDYDDDEGVDEKKMTKARKSKKATTNAKKKSIHLSADGDDDMDDDESVGEAESRDTKGNRTKGKGGRITGLQAILQEKAGTPLMTNDEEEENLDEYLQKAPASCREYITNGVRMLEQERAQLVEYIFNHENNFFTKEYLSELELAELQGIAALAESKNKNRMNFVGAASGYQSPLRNQNDVEEALVAPVMNWDK